MKWSILHNYRGLDSDPFARGAVLLFFVHTSLVLMQSLKRSEVAGDNIVSSFIIRRVFRLYPLSIVCILIVLALHIPRSFRSGPFSMPGWSAVLANLLLVQNITKDASVTLPLWSLPYEMQVYFLLPFVYLSIRSPRSVRGTMLWFAASALAAPIACLVSYQAAYILQFLPCFMAGVVGYKLTSQRQAARWPSWCWTALILVLWASYGFAVSLQHVSIWSFSLRNFSAAAITSLILGWMLPRFRQTTNPSLVFITKRLAKYSYGIYLAHQSIMWVSFIRFGKLPVPVQWFAFVILAFTLPVLFFHLVEQPMIEMGRRLSCLARPRAPNPQLTVSQ